MAPYYPMSLTGYEPAVRTERFEYIRTLQLSFPCVLLKVDVGGTIGTLHWILRRDGPDTDDAGQIEEARLMIKPIIPQVHNRHLKKAYIQRVRGVVKMPKSVCEMLYRELTGDESTAENKTAVERLAFTTQQLQVAETFTLAVGNSKIILDLRAIANAATIGKTAFGDFWQCGRGDLIQTAGRDDGVGGVGGQGGGRGGQKPDRVLP